MGRQRSPRHQDGSHVIPYLRAANVKDGELDLASVLEMNFLPLEQAKFGLRPGDVLVTEGCGSLAQIGASARWDGQLDGPVCFQNTLLRLRAIDGLTDPEFVHQWARWAFAAGAFAATATGTSIFHVGAKRAAEMSFPDIPMAEQRRIADLLSTLEADLKATRLALNALRSLLSARREQLIAPLGSWSNVPDGWRLVRLDELVDLRLGFTKGRRLTGEMVTLPYLRAANVHDGEVRLDDVRREAILASEASKWALHLDDLVMIEGGNPEDLGRGWIWEGEIEPCIHQNSVFRGRVKREDVVPRFLAYAITCRQARMYCEGSSIQTSNIAHIGTARMAALQLPLPPLEEQRAIVEALDAIRTAAVVSSERIERSRHFVEAIRDVLLSGAREIPVSYDRFVPENRATGASAPVRV